MSKANNQSLGITEVDTESIRDLTVHNLKSSEIFVSISETITIDLANFGLQYGIGGKACMISVFDTDTPPNFASANGYFHFGDAVFSVPYGLTSCTQLNGISITLTAALIVGNNYGLKIDYPGIHRLLLRVLLF